MLVSLAMTVGWIVAAGSGGAFGFGHGGQLAVSAWIYPVGLVMGASRLASAMAC